jgi:hypothetical protein
MALEFMRDEMVRQIKERSATEGQVANYLADWNDAMKHSGKPLPCPLCYLKGEIQRLKSISEEHGLAVVRCEPCREKFEFESPETE